MAKRKRSKQSKKTGRTRKSLRVDSSLLTTLIDEIDELVELLRFLPELNILSKFFQERAREIEEIVVDHDRIATIAMSFFGRDLDELDQEERDNACESVEARFGIDPPMYAHDLIGAPEAVIDAVRWRLQRLGAVLEMLH